MFRSGKGERRPANWKEFRHQMEHDLTSLLDTELREDGADKAYVLLSSGLNGRQDAGLWGHTSADLCHVMRDVIGDRWSGPGPAIVINDVAIDQIASAAWFPHKLPVGAALSAHEAAHRVVDRLFAPQHTGSTEASYFDQIQTLATRPAGAVSRGEWLVHGPDFIRASIHLAYRLARLGWTIAAGNIFCPTQAGVQSRSDKYYDCLENECERLAGVPVREVLMVEPCGEFLLLWWQDSHAWRQ